MSNELDELAKGLNADLDEAYAVDDAGEQTNQDGIDTEATIEVENAADDAGSETETMAQDAEQNNIDGGNTTEQIAENNDAENSGAKEKQPNDVIPIARFTEVNRERRRLERYLKGAEKSKSQLQKRVEELEQQQKLIAGRFDGELPDVNNILSDEKMTRLREDFGDELADVMQALAMRAVPKNNVSSAETVIDEQEITAPQYQQNDVDADEEWSNLIASAPPDHQIHKLDYWGQFEPDKFEKAQQIEQQMMQSGEHNSFTNIADFYADVVRRVETANNSVNTQAQSAPVFKEQQAPAGQGVSQDGMPASIGDLGGAAVQPSGDLVMELGGLDPKALLSRFENMTPEQKQAYNAELWGDI